MESLFQFLIIVCAGLSSALVSFQDLVGSKAIKFLTDKQILKRIIIEANGAYWHNKEYEAKGRMPLGFKIFMLLFFMLFVIGILVVVVCLLISVVVLLLSMLILTCENHKLFNCKITTNSIENVEKIKSKCV